VSTEDRLAPESEPTPRRTDASAAGSGTRRVGGGSKSLWSLSPALFLFPALLVAVAVLVYLLFVASSKDSRTVGEILQDMRSGGSHSRRQDAFALSTRVTELAAKGGAPRYFTDSETDELLRLLEESPDDDELRAYLVRAVGRAGQPAKTLPVLAKMLADEETPLEVRTNVVAALSLSRSREAVEPLVQELRRRPGADEWEVRWLAAQALVNVTTGGEELSDAQLDDPVARIAVRELRALLADTRREVSWNAAYYLARYFNDAAGATILDDVVRREFLDGERGDRGRELTDLEKESWIQFALEGLYRLRGAALRPVLEAKKNDPSVKVRHTALSLLERLGTRGASAAPEAPADRSEP